VRKYYERSYAASAMVLFGFLLVVLKHQWRSTEGCILIALISIMVLFFVLSSISIHYQDKRRNRRINGLINKLATFAFGFKIGQISLYLGFVALIIGLIQYGGYPWGLGAAVLLVISADVFLFWSTLRKLGKKISAQRDSTTQVS
jgi:hypothetical protein